MTLNLFEGMSNRSDSRGGSKTSATKSNSIQPLESDSKGRTGWTKSQKQALSLDSLGQTKVRPWLDQVGPEGTEAPRGNRSSTARRRVVTTAPGTLRDRLTALGRSSELAPDGEPLWYWECACRRIVLEAPSVVADWAESRTACCRACLWGEEPRTVSEGVGPAVDDLAVWRARLARTCGGCGAHGVEPGTRCEACGFVKSLARQPGDDLGVDGTGRSSGP